MSPGLRGGSSHVIMWPCLKRSIPRTSSIHIGIGLGNKECTGLRVRDFNYKLIYSIQQYSMPLKEQLVKG